MAKRRRVLFTEIKIEIRETPCELGMISEMIDMKFTLSCYIETAF